MNHFESCFLGYDTDKVKGWQYQDAYEDSFFIIRPDIKLIFEIGVHHGGSLRGFRDYFPHATIVGLDVDPATYLPAEDRLAVHIGDATDKNFIDKIIRSYGQPDIVIDDGSHMSTDIKKSYELLYPHTKVCYVIEDLVTQYPEILNGSCINDGVPATKIIHGKVDEILLKRDSFKSLRIYHSIAFIFK